MSPEELLALAIPEIEKLVEAEIANGKIGAEIRLALEEIKLLLTSKAADLKTLVQTADNIADAAEVAKFGK